MRARNTLGGMLAWLACVGGVFVGTNAAFALPWAPVAPVQQRPGVVEQWGQVVTVTKDWVVLQNAQGQQYPVSLRAINLFICRWPTTLDRIGLDALIEARGNDLGTVVLGTDHIDVFQGSALSLVSPALLYLKGSGLAYRPIDYTFDKQVYGEPFPGLTEPIQGGVNVGPAMIHVVGPLFSRVPLRIQVNDGANVITVVAPPQGINMTQVTLGSPAFVRPGDQVYFAAVEARPKSLILDQLVVYKAMPIDQFAP